uniref:C2H2-type domain-containing protein n=1 Tax=Kryptolebias marmoratus TaxID=37003 RepID=A0A3Q3A1W7_KRYMA
QPVCSERRRGRSSSNISALQEELDSDEDAAEISLGDQDRDDDWKPDPEELLPAGNERKRSRRVLEGEEKRKRPCKVCGLWYRAAGGLIRHAWSHLDDPQSVCGVCAESFASPQELKEHLQSHQKTNECSYCGKTFITTTGLNNHISLHTGDRPFKCNVCNKAFAYKSALSVHRWVHMEEKPHRCDLCPRSFGLNAQLTAHRKCHANRDKYICNLCGRSLYDLSFKLQGTLGERPFVCSVCSKGFLNTSELRNHMRVHTGEAPFGCSECGRFFKLRSTLKAHILTHSGIKRFICAVCGKQNFGGRTLVSRTLVSRTLVAELWWQNFGEQNFGGRTLVSRTLVSRTLVAELWWQNFGEQNHHVWNLS